MNEFKELESYPGKLIEVSEETFDQALEILPPLWAKGCFGMGEIHSHTSEKVYYSVKETWGFCPLKVVASGATLEEAKTNTKKKLQNRHGGLWLGEYKNCYIGSKKWLEQEFSEAKGALLTAIENYQIEQ